MENNNGLDIALVIPIFNEEKYLPFTLESIEGLETGEWSMGVIFVDGNSTDNSVNIIQDFAERDGNIKIIILDNPKKNAASGLNIGIEEALKRGAQVIGFGGAHVLYPKNYLLESGKLILLEKHMAVGGKNAEFIVLDEGTMAKAMSFLYKSPIGAGVRKIYRSNKPTETDTFFGGMFDASVFNKVGRYDESLVRGQDIDFNTRVITAGFRLWYYPSLDTKYILKTSAKAFWGRAFKTGYYLPQAIKKNRKLLKLHYVLPSVLVLYLLLMPVLALVASPSVVMFAPLLAYALLLVSNAIGVIPKSTLKIAILTIPVFSLYHVFYGFGGLIGVIAWLKSCLVKNEVGKKGVPYNGKYNK